MIASCGFHDVVARTFMVRVASREGSPHRHPAGYCASK
jgi:hypothetical protein